MTGSGTLPGNACRILATALLKFAAELNRQPTKVTGRDIAALRTYGYKDEQILETVLIVGLAKFSNYVAFGLGTAPDFDASKIMRRPRPGRVKTR